MYYQRYPARKKRRGTKKTILSLKKHVMYEKYVPHNILPTIEASVSPRAGEGYCLVLCCILLKIEKNMKI